MKLFICLALSFAAMVFAAPDALTEKDLYHLLIEQINYHQNPDDSTFGLKIQALYRRYGRVEKRVVPALSQELFPKMIDLPVLVFIPHSASEHSLAPAIIHVHGGPQVIIDEDTVHAEIAYFLSHGFVVFCPNYRGSADITLCQPGDPWCKAACELMLFLRLEKADLVHTGPEDILATVRYAQSLPFVQKDKLILRGGSYGSYLNARFMMKMGSDRRFSDTGIRGVHFSGGLNYPATVSDFPADVAVLVTHGEKDKIASFLSARQFWSKFCKSGRDNVFAFFAAFGDHHLIDKTHHYGEDGPQERELASYVHVLTSFVHDLAEGKALVHEKPPAETPLEIAWHNLGPTARDLAQEIAKYQLFEESKTRVIKQELPQKAKHFSFAQLKTACKEKLASRKAASKNLVGPTTNHLRKILKRKFTGDIETDLVRFFSEHYHPLDWSNKHSPIFLENGKEIIENTATLAQLVAMVEKERQFLTEHPDHVVFYHAASQGTLQLYTLFTLWHSVLTGTEATSLYRLRASDLAGTQSGDIHDFLQAMRRTAEGEKVPMLNYCSGYSQKAIAATTMLSYRVNTACSSAFCYASDDKNLNDAPHVLKNFLKLMGVYSPNKYAEYRSLFLSYREAEQGKQKVMQQIFMKADAADRSAYLCEIWGRTFLRGAPLKMSQPSVLVPLNHGDTHTVKQALKKSYLDWPDLEIFDGFATRADRLPLFSKQALSALDAVQARIIIGPEHREVYTYVKDEQNFKEFQSALAVLVARDILDRSNDKTCVPKGIISEPCVALAAFQLSVGEQSQDLAPTDEALAADEEAFFEYQQGFALGQIADFDFDEYERLRGALSPQAKSRVHERILKLNLPTLADSVFAFTSYLQGFTYFDIITLGINRCYPVSVDESSKHTEIREKLLEHFRNHAVSSKGLIMDIASPEKYLELRMALEKAVDAVIFDYELFASSMLHTQYIFRSSACWTTKAVALSLSFRHVDKLPLSM